MPDHKSMAIGAGLVGPLVGFATTLLAAALSPTFRWTADGLSALGAATAAAPALFNYGLVISALLTVPFVWPLWTVSANRIERLGAATFGATVLALGLVGVFPLGTDLHAPVAIAYFTLLTLTLWVNGSGWALAGLVERGLLAIWLGIGHVLFWLGWVALGPGGVAVPELVGSLVFFAWILLAVRTRPAALLGSE